MRMVAHKRLVQEYYSRRAKDYDRQKIRTWKLRQGFSDEVFQGLIDSLTGLKSKPVLEACVGTGRTALPLLENVKPWLVGLDFSKEMLNVANAKLLSWKRKFSPAMGDAECLPFRSEAFNAVICTSALHYFAKPEKILAEFLRVLHAKGVFVYGDLTLHERDSLGFLNRLENTASKVHKGYLKPSKIRSMLEDSGLHVYSTDTIVYRKPFNSLIEDKATYFGVNPAAISKCVRTASSDEKALYGLSNDGLDLYYTLIKAVKDEI